MIASLRRVVCSIRSLPGTALTACAVAMAFVATGAAHGPMPVQVSPPPWLFPLDGDTRGERSPPAKACGDCHTPSGQGRPDNAPLAALPADYIVAQVRAMRTGARHGATPHPYPPDEAMYAIARAVDDADLVAAAAWFAAQTLRPHVVVRESTTVPRTRVVDGLYVADPGAGREALGERLLELAPVAARRRDLDERLVYRVYVPPGSLARGRALSEAGVPGATPACGSCHGADLRGVGIAPPLAGRSPSYLLRQLVAFKIHARDEPAARIMQLVLLARPMPDLIAAAAYAGAQPP